MPVPSASSRDARLDALSSALDAWSTQRTKYLNNQVAFLNRVLKGRGGASNATKTATDKANALAVNNMTQFLSGA